MLSKLDRECESIGADHAADDDQVKWNSGVETGRPIDDDLDTGAGVQRVLRCH